MKPIQMLGRFLSVVCLLPTSQVLAHAAIEPTATFRSRTGTNQDLLKTAPCGAAPAPAAPSMQLTGNATFSMTIRETIQHNGFFAIEWSEKSNPTGNADFVVLNNVLDDIYGNNGVDESKVVTFKVPAYNCTHCVVRVIQWMTGGNLELRTAAAGDGNAIDPARRQAAQALMDSLNSTDPAVRAAARNDPRLATMTPYYSCADVSVAGIPKPVNAPPTSPPSQEPPKKGDSLSNDKAKSECNE